MQNLFKAVIFIFLLTLTGCFGEDKKSKAPKKDIFLLKMTAEILR